MIDVVYWPLDLAVPPHDLLDQVRTLASAAMAAAADRKAPPYGGPTGNE